MDKGTLLERVSKQIELVEARMNQADEPVDMKNLLELYRILIEVQFYIQVKTSEGIDYE